MSRKNSIKGKVVMRNNIDRVIQQKSMSQGELAEIVGVRREYLNLIIHRKIIPAVDLGMRIAGALDVSVEMLFVLGE